MTVLTLHLDDEKARRLQNEAKRAGMSVEELIGLSTDVYLAASQPAKKKPMSATLKELQDTLPPDFVPPTDEQVKEMLHERRMRRALM
jgi:hypothetical protein